MVKQIVKPSRTTKRVPPEIAVVWDWMDHDTGKSHKLGEADMSEMRDMLAEMLNMQRGQKKSETGLDHLERNDFILQKQEKEKKRLEEEKRREKYSIDTSNDWKDPALRAVSGYLVATNEVIKYSIEAIQDYAYSGTGGRGGNHGDCFSDKEAYIIKKLMMNLAAIAKTTFQVIGNWLVYVASRIAKFNDWEINRAERGVKSVADGEYDWRIDRIDRGRGGGVSR